MRLLQALGLALLLASLAACEMAPSPAPPPGSLEVGNAIGELYVRAGVNLELGSRNVRGMHYRPGTDSWKVVACTEFRVPDGQDVNDCNDSFELYRLNSGRWMVNGTVNGKYLWLEMPQS